MVKAERHTGHASGAFEAPRHSGDCRAVIGAFEAPRRSGGCRAVIGAFEAPRRGGDACYRIWTHRGAVAIAALKRSADVVGVGPSVEVEVEVAGAGCPGAGVKCVATTLVLRRRLLQGPVRSVGLPIHLSDTHPNPFCQRSIHHPSGRPPAA